MDPLSFAARIMAYCASTGGSVTSWGRTSLHNAGVGGVDGSYHLSWLGADVVYDLPALPLTRRQTSARHVGLEIIAEADHDHLEPLP